MSPGARYVLLLLLLAALVWWQPILWELALVGMLAGAAWLLSRPTGGADDGEVAADSPPTKRADTGKQSPASDLPAEKE